MLTIAIDTSQDICTLALGQENKLLCEYHFHHKMDLLQRIMPNIEHVMSDSGKQVGDLDGIIASLGPGSFTGLRIGITIAKTLAYVLSKPIVGVGTLDIIARGIAPSTTTYICPMIFARTAEVYWSLFDSTGDVRLEDYSVSPVQQVLEKLEMRGGNVFFCGTGATRNAEAIRHKYGNSALCCKPFSDFARGAALIEAGGRLLKEGHISDPLALTPMYIKKPTPVVKLETGGFERNGGGA